MSIMELLVAGIIAIPAIGLTAAGVLLILKRTRFSATGSVVALVLGILAISFGAALVLALIFVAVNLGSVAVGPTLGEKLFSEADGATM